MPTKKRIDPDAALRHLDNYDELRFVMLESTMAEDLFAKHYMDIELDPQEVLILKLLRGRFANQADFWDFIDEFDLRWISDNGYIRLAPDPRYKDSFSPNNEIMYPAGFGKTTVITIDGVMECCENPNSRNLEAFKNANEGHSMSKAIRQWLVTPKIKEDFGQMKPQGKDLAWSDSAFSLHGREIADIRDNFSFYGTNSDDALGKRSDRVIMDDIETTDTARTPDACQKLIEWVQTGPFTSPRPRWPKTRHGVSIPPHISWPRHRLYWGVNHLGTIFHPKGLHAFCAENEGFNVLRIDCYKDRQCTTSISPQLMSTEDLESEYRKLGPLVFNKRYRNIAYDPAEMAFQEVWLKGGSEHIHGQKIVYPGCLDEDHAIGDIPDGAEVYVGFDPASGSKSRWSAYSAYVVLAAKDNDLWVVDFSKHQEDFSRMLDRLLDGNPDYGIEGYLTKYQAKAAVVEKNAFATWVINNDRTMPFAQKGQIIPSWTGTNKLDPEMGVFGMATIVKDGRLHIPWKNASDKEKSAVLVNDMCLFPKTGTDLVMSLWLASIPLARRTTYKTGFRSPQRNQRMIHRL